MAHAYKPRVQDSNFEPIGLQVKREGVLLPPLGVTVTVNIKTSDTNPKVAIVTDGVAAAVSGQDGRWEFRFTPEQAALITTDTKWLVEWTLTVGGYKWRSEQAVLPVRKRL